jgi:hypothetical protein
MGWLRIRNTDVSVLDVLDMLAEDRSFDEIIGRYPSVSSADIAAAAAMARYLIIYHWAVCRAPDSALLPDPRQPGGTKVAGSWSTQKERELTELYRTGASVGDIARILMMRQTEIVERLKALNMI